MLSLIKRVLRPMYHAGRGALDEAGLWLRRKATTFARRTDPFVSRETFLILCVKRPQYVALAIKNINTLHLHDHHISVVVYVDDACEPTFRSAMRRLDYPLAVRLVNRFGSDTRPWQLLKVDTLMDAAEKGWILVDADTVWHAAPAISKEKVTFLVRAYDFGEIEAERELLKSFGRTDLLNRPHYVTGLVSIPSQFYTRELHESCLAWTARVLKSETLKRIAEEIGVNIAVQSAVSPEDILTLKSADGPNDTNIMQSLYYGCINKVDE